MFAIWAVLVATLGFVWYFRKLDKIKRLKGLKELPGPTGLPVLGSILELGQYPNKKHCLWAKQYGSMYQVQVGNFKTVAISDPKLVKEIYSNDPVFTGRLISPIFSFWEDTPGLGLFGSEGELWATHRRFLLRQLRDFGFGKSSLESSIMEEVNWVIEMYRSKVGQPVTSIRETLRLAVVNALWNILSSERFEQNDPRLLRLTNNTSKAFNEILEKGGLLLFMPWIKYISPELSGYKKVREVLDDMKDFFVKSLEQHKKNFKEDDLKDFMDVYLAEMKKAGEDKSSQFYGEIAERQLVSTLFDMFNAGSDTTAITTAWTSLYLCKFPNVQTKFQAEISEVTSGDSRHVSLTDRPNMPYTLALIDEILRFSSIVPDGVPHRAMADSEFHGYFIEKDMLIQPNLHFIHFNPEIWGDPENFRPERFLTGDGKKYVRNENLMAFQPGRRQCAGESLARDQIFLFLTNLFQKLSMKFDPTEPEPSFEAEVGFLRAPLPYKVIMTDRFAKHE